MQLANPQTRAAFLRRPTREEWKAELGAGWSGPDGSSWSFDTFLGADIGRTGWDYDALVDTAAGRHDWYYRLARRLRLPGRWRKAADEWYRDRLVAQAKEHRLRMTPALPLDLLAKLVRQAERWAGLRYRALRLFGRGAWCREARPPGGWPRRPTGRKTGARQWDRARRRQIAAQWASWEAEQARQD